MATEPAKRPAKPQPKAKATVAAASAAQKPSRGNITNEARQKGIKARQERGLFNKYIAAIGKTDGRTSNSEDIDAVLAAGTRKKNSAVFVNGKRTGSTKKELPLLPAERAHLLAKKKALAAKPQNKVSTDLRSAFLAMLPDYAARYGMDAEILASVGVPADDIAAAGL